MKLSLSVLPLSLSICRLQADAAFPSWIQGLPFWSITRTAGEMSLVLPDEAVPTGWKSESGWRALKVDGPLDFSLTGVLSSIATPLAAAGISLFSLSTFDTDYILVKNSQLQPALRTLEDNGFEISPTDAIN